MLEFMGMHKSARTEMRASRGQGSACGENADEMVTPRPKTFGQPVDIAAFLALGLATGFAPCGLDVVRSHLRASQHCPSLGFAMSLVMAVYVPGVACAANRLFAFGGCQWHVHGSNLSSEIFAASVQHGTPTSCSCTVLF